MTYTDLAVDVRHEDHGGVGAASSLTIAKRRRGHPSGLDSLPLFPGCWPLPLETYDRRTELTAAETSALKGIRGAPVRSARRLAADFWPIPVIASRD